MNNQSGINTVLIGIGINLLLVIIKGITGYIGNSYALIADAIESTSDVLSSVLVVIALKYSSRPADSNHPYGHGRIEPLVTFIVVGYLIISAVVISYQSIENILTPHQLPERYTLVVLFAVIVLKEILYRNSLAKSKEINSTPIKADAWHHRSDAITSFAAFIGISIAIIFGDGYETADDWAALVSVFIILYNSFLIFRPAFGEIMDENLYEEVIIQIREIAKQVNGVVGTEKCFVRKIGTHYHVDLHAIVNGDISVNEGHKISHDLKDTLKKQIPELVQILIHIEPHEYT